MSRRLHRRAGHRQIAGITITSIYENPCEVPASFTAMLDAGNEPNVFYTYVTDRNQVLDAGQAADITPYVNTKTVPDLNDIVPTALAAVTAGKTLYGLPTTAVLRLDPGGAAGRGGHRRRVAAADPALGRAADLPADPRGGLDLRAGGLAGLTAGSLRAELHVRKS